MSAQGQELTEEELEPSEEGDTEATEEVAGPPSLASALISGLVALLVVVDIQLDRDMETSAFHVALELITVAVAGGGAVAL